MENRMKSSIVPERTETPDPGLSDGRNRDQVVESSESWPSTAKPAGTFRRFFGKYSKDPLASSKNPPWFDARGVAVGLAVGFGVPLGAQMIVLGLLRALFRFNSVVAFAFTWVNNPLSVLPMYYGYYRFGSWLLGRPTIMGLEDFQALMRPIFHASYFWESFGEFVYLGWDLVLRWSITAVLVGVLTGILGYVAALRVQKKRCRKRAEEMGLSYEALAAKLEKRCVGKDGRAQ